MAAELMPSTEEWRELYSAALAFKELAPWEWMNDGDIFGVKDPASGEVGYCCVMGAMGEHYALGLYLGSEGLNSLLKINSGEFSRCPEEGFYVQKCLMVSFEDRKYLHKEDVQQINALALKFRGSNSWPLFRNYSPGFVPWFLTGKEARFLAAALRQAVDVCLRFKKNPGMLASSPSENKFLVRVPEKTGDNVVWRDERLESLPLKTEDTPVVFADEAVLNKLKNAGLRQGGVWEADFFYAPMPIREKAERPYFPFMSLLVDRRSGIILDMQMGRRTDLMSKFPDEFADFTGRMKVLPDEILVKRREVYCLVEPVFKELGVRTTLIRSLPAVEAAQNAMTNLF
ncbi:hypothetical protein HZC09_05130 [Candidatus Micrarchaeota archaeon]|nr:hypothetical protein [Candidatus Micrarchaeota archaeon]